MSHYKIASERVGEVGAPFDVEAAAEAGINVEALIANGFISKASNTKQIKSDTVEEAPKEN